MRRHLRNLFATLGVIAFLLAILPDTRAEAGIAPTPAQAAHLQEHPEDLPRTGDYVFGWSNSPLASYHDEYTLTDRDGKVTAGHETRLHIGWLSWSSMTLAISVALLWLAGRIKAPK